MARRHLEIFWDATFATHEVFDFGEFSLTCDGRPLDGWVTAACGSFSPGRGNHGRLSWLATDGL
jgi:hypothetical protein